VIIQRFFKESVIVTRCVFRNVRSNQLYALPHQVALLTNLEDLDLQENKFQVAAEDIPGLGLMGMIKYFQACATSQVTKKISLNVMGITDIPSDILNSSMLTNLSLMSNRIAELPTAFGQNLTNLQKVNLRSNQLTRIPESFSKLCNSLETLDLSFNAFTFFPAPVCELKRVTFLDFSNNQLTTVHDAIGAMLDLEHLRLDKNELKKLPITLGRLPRLHTLNLRYNKLNDLTGAFAGCTTITNLDLRNNNIVKVPTDFGG